MFRDPKLYLLVDYVINPYYMLEELSKVTIILGDRSYRYRLLKEN
jgi:hypothetical protein